METIATGSIVILITSVILGVIARVITNKIQHLEDKLSSMWKRIDEKQNTKDCLLNHRDQMKVNHDLIERFARVETKVDLLLNGRKQ